MKVSVTKENDWKRVLEIEIPQERVQKEFEEIYLKFQKEAKLPGFRPGKAPLQMIKSKFREAASEEVLESLLNSSYRQALEETRLNPLNIPKVSDVKFAPDSNLSFKAEIEIQPVIEVKDYKKLKLARKIHPLTDPEVDQAVERLRERNAELRPVERAAREKDFVVVDLVEEYGEKSKPASQKYENQLLEIEPGVILKEFQEALIGAKTGEEKTFAVEYPKEYPNQRVAGQKVTYRLKIKEVKEKVLPALDDHFAKAQGDYQTLLELRLKIREALERGKKEESQKELERMAIGKLVEKNGFPVPEVLINSYLDYLVEDVKKRYPEANEIEIRQKNLKPAQERIRWEFIYHQLAEKEGMAVTASDLEARIKNFATVYNLPPDKAEEYLTQTRQMEKLKESILEEKVLEFIISQAEIKEERMEKK